MRAINLLFWCLWPVSLWAQPFSVKKQTVLFDHDSYMISTAGLQKLTSWCDSVSQLPLLLVKITGHTDADGSNAYNQTLSEKRAQQVYDFLKKYFPPAKMHIAYKGETQPVDENISEKGKQHNRRVEISITVPNQPDSSPSETIRDLYLQTQLPLQVFTVNTNRDTVLVGEQNTWIYIPARSFIPCNGNNSVQFYLKEVFRKSDMILENLATTSNGRPLESGGMIYTEARCNDGNRVSPVKEITVLIPADSIRPDMKLFNGDRHDIADIINWTLNNNEQLRGVGWNDLDSCESTEGGIPCERCKFWCRAARIGKPFAGSVVRPVRESNRALRSCQRMLRKRERQMRRGTWNPSTGNGVRAEIIQRPLPCQILDQLMQQYNARNYNDLLLKMNNALLEKYNVKSLDELRDTLQQRAIREKAAYEKNLLKKIETGNIDKVSELDHYMFSTRRLGWINCDAFTDFPGRKKIDMQVVYTPRENRDCKLVFPDRRAILPGKPSGDNYDFLKVPEGMKALLVLLQIKAGQPYLLIREISIAEKITDVEPVPVTLEELQARLRILDF